MDRKDIRDGRRVKARLAFGWAGKGFGKRQGDAGLLLARFGERISGLLKDDNTGRPSLVSARLVQLISGAISLPSARARGAQLYYSATARAESTVAVNFVGREDLRVFRRFSFWRHPLAWSARKLMRVSAAGDIFGKPGRAAAIMKPRPCGRGPAIRRGVNRASLFAPFVS